jgi:hypothetical protein
MSFEDYDEMYGNVEASNNFEDVPEGTYQVFIDKISLGETKKDPIRPMLSWALKIMSGEHEGRFLFKNDVVNTNSKETIEKSLGFIKTDLSVAGLAECKFSDVAGSLHTLLNTQLEVKVVNKTYKKNGKDVPIQNVWIQKTLDLGEANSDDIPF